MNITQNKTKKKQRKTINKNRNKTKPNTTAGNLVTPGENMIFIAGVHFFFRLICMVLLELTLEQGLWLWPSIKIKLLLRIHVSVKGDVCRIYTDGL